MANSIYDGAITVGTTAVQAFPSPTRSKFNNGLYIKSMPTNTGIIYVGDLGITTSVGFPLSAGEGIFVSFDQLGDLYLISDTAGQSVRYLNAY